MITDSELRSTGDVFSMYPTDPVTSPGFAPALFASNETEPRVGQVLTAVVYRDSSSSHYSYSEEEGWSDAYPGVALKVPLQVLEPESCDPTPFWGVLGNASFFCAAAPEEDPSVNSWAVSCDGTILALVYDGCVYNVPPRGRLTRPSRFFSGNR